MTRNLAAGLLMCRENGGVHEFFLVHPGGPFFKKKASGCWTIPKGMPEPGEQLIDTARREFMEETGIQPTPPFHDLGMVKQKGGKVVQAWSFSGSWDPATGITCNTFALEWPLQSGKMVEFPEVDKASWMDYELASRLIIAEQIPFLERALDIFKK